MERPYFTREEWIPSELEDYRSARSDDERRRMLLRFGVDPAHQAEADRLFCEEQTDQDEADHALTKDGGNNAAQDLVVLPDHPRSKKDKVKEAVGYLETVGQVGGMVYKIVRFIVDKLCAFLCL